MGKCSLRTTVLPGPCLHLPSLGADKASDSPYKLNYMCIYMEQDSAPYAMMARPGLSSMPHEILPPFPKKIQKDLDALPLERALVWEREKGGEKLLDFRFVYTGFGRHFGPSQKHRTKRHHIMDKKWGHTLEKHHQGSVKEHGKDQCNSHIAPYCPQQGLS